MMMPGLFMASVSHHMRTKQATYAGDRASKSAAEVRTQNEAITCDLEKLMMITEALWTFIKGQHGLSDEYLVNMLQDIDLRDGKLDGKVAKQENPNCPHCGRKLMGKHPICLYCGTAVDRNPFER